MNSELPLIIGRILSCGGILTEIVDIDVVPQLAFYRLFAIAVTRVSDRCERIDQR